MNVDRHKPFTMYQKVRKLYAHHFILSEADRATLIDNCINGVITRDREAVEYIDHLGEWLD